jgi:hypothetical protein
MRPRLDEAVSGFEGVAIDISVFLLEVLEARQRRCADGPSAMRPGRELLRAPAAGWLMISR